MLPLKSTLVDTYHFVNKYRTPHYDRLAFNPSVLAVSGRCPEDIQKTSASLIEKMDNGYEKHLRMVPGFPELLRDLNNVVSSVALFDDGKTYYVVLAKVCSIVTDQTSDAVPKNITSLYVPQPAFVGATPITEDTTQFLFNLFSAIEAESLLFLDKVFLDNEIVV